MVVASVTCSVLPAKQQECCATFARLLRRTRRRPGCLAARLVSDPVDPFALSLVSEWATRDACEAYVASDDFGVVRGMRFLMTADLLLVVDEVRAP